jgi:hypothetical protein
MNQLRILDEDGHTILTGTIETGKARSARRVPGNKLEVKTRKGWEQRWVIQVRHNAFYTRISPPEPVSTPEPRRYYPNVTRCPSCGSEGLSPPWVSDGMQMRQCYGCTCHFGVSLTEFPKEKAQ